MRDGKGHWILDSPANNAMAHDLHNMFYILGLTRETSARPARLIREKPQEEFANSSPKQ